MPLHNTPVPGAPRQVDPLVAQVADAIDAGALIPPGATVLVGVSGGGDSVALLSILRELARSPQRRWRLIAAHLNHRLRDDADEDEAFVRQLARRWRIDLIVERTDVRDLACHRGLGIEEAARDARYEFFLRAAADVHARNAPARGARSAPVRASDDTANSPPHGGTTNAVRVAVAHHGDDNVETVLHRLARGTHLRGLAGMPAARPLDADGHVLLVRPLLEVRREQIQAYLRRRKLAWRSDPTNADTRFRRNLIRHELLPVLRRLNPQADAAILRLARTAGQVETHLARQARQALVACRIDPARPQLGLSVERLAAMDRLVRRTALRQELERLRVPMDQVPARTLEELADLGEGRRRAVNLPGDLVARRRAQAIVFDPASPSPAPRQEAMELACPGRTALADGRIVVCRVERCSPRTLERHLLTRQVGVELLDADRVHGPLVCRSRRRGDAFGPLGRGGRKSVSDFLTDLKLPRPRRDSVLCVCDRGGIVYLAPLRIANRVRLGPSTRRVLRIRVEPPFAPPCD